MSMWEERKLSYEAKRLLEIIENSGCAGGGITGQCDCGRHYYAEESNVYDWEEGEFESYEKDPNMHYYDGDSVYHIEFFGRTYVVGCECKFLENVASLIWGERKAILQYIKSRHDYNKVYVLETEAMLGDTTELAEKLGIRRA